MAEELERLLSIAKKTRAISRSAATKTISAAKAVKNVRSDNQVNAASTLKRLKSLKADLLASDLDIQRQLPESQLDDDIAKSFEYQENLSVAAEMLEAQIDEFNALSKANSGANSSGKDDTVSPKLPKLSLLTFDGDPLKWESFWDDFSSSVDSRENITTSDKFKLLRSVLEGEAKGIVDGYTLTKANYVQVKDELKERYGDQQVVIFAHFEKLLALQSASHNMSELRRVHDLCESHIRSLVALGLTEDTFGQVFVPILLSKFPKFVKMELYRRNGSNKWSLSSLRTLLKDEIRARDMSERTNTVPETANSRDNRGQNKGKPRTETSSALISQASASETTSTKSKACAFCAGKHPSWNCHVYPDFQSRNARVGGKCKRCLSEGHFVKGCSSKGVCHYCKRANHHSSLCMQRFGTPKGHQASTKQFAGSKADAKEPGQYKGLSATAAEFTPTTYDSSSVANTAATKGIGCAVMKSARAVVSGSKLSTTAQFLFDDGSTMSFVSSNFVKKIGAKATSTRCTQMGRFGDPHRSSVTWNMHEVRVQLPSGQFKTICLSEVDHISAPIRLVPMDLDRNPFLATMELAQPLVSQPVFVEVDILIGLDLYYDFIGSEHRRCVDGVVLHHSLLGFIASGFVSGIPPMSESNVESHLVAHSGCYEARSDIDLEKFWSIEEIGITDSATDSDDDIAQAHFDRNVSLKDGRYTVQWPYKFANPQISDTFGLAYGRLKSLLCRNGNGTPIFNEYQKILAEQVNRGIIEEAPEVPQGLVYYMPHHPVVKPKRATTKVRIVYDCSAKASKDSYSLNECLLKGPVILTDLVGNLLRFRKHSIAITSDIEKAFHMIALDLTARDVTRFLWVRDPTQPLGRHNLVVFRFCRVPFGMVSSPFLLSATIGHHLRKNDGETARSIIRNTYVDNIIGGHESVDQAFAYYQRAKALMKSASMNLRQWSSNSLRLISLVDPTDLASSPVTNVLGVSWDTKKDTVSCSLGSSGFKTSNTKRSVLAALASLFDPCGWFCPVSISCRILMQKIWVKELPWDQVLPPGLQMEWRTVQTSLEQVPNLPISRYLGLDSANMPVELHVFVDASKKAYAAVVYVRFESQGRIEVKLICAKAKVAPIKQLTIPRLELIAMVIGLRLVLFVERELDQPVARKIMWSDSECALSWVIGNADKPVFVANRVREIRSDPNIAFRYVPSSLNPADVASRGISFSDLKVCDPWWNGPLFLSETEENWPSQSLKRLKDSAQQIIEEIGPEIDKSAILVQPSSDSHLDPVFDLSRFSNLPKLLRVTALVKRFKGISLRKQKFENQVSGSELSYSLIWWVKREQLRFFGQLSVVTGKGKQSCFERQLRLFVDDQGVIRSRGRIDNAEVDPSVVNPILLPSQSRLTRLIIEDLHRRSFHAGAKHLLSQLRQTYWAVKGRNIVKQVIHECAICNALSRKPFRIPDEPPLPSFRVTANRAFVCIGVDYAGPLTAICGTQRAKVWVCLYTCAATRAIHLELMQSLSTTDFILGFRRFVALHGLPRVVVSDNAKHFRASDRILRKLWRDIIQDPSVREYSSSNNITWKFIPEFGPWFGGFYERLVAPVKAALHRSLGQKCVPISEMQTLCYEISAVLNSRPLVCSGFQIGDTGLTPSQLMGKFGQQFPDFLVTDNFDENVPETVTGNTLLEMWNFRQKVLSKFWNDWRNSYLLSLRERNSARTQRGVSGIEPAIGQVVIVKDALPRGKWRLGRISKLNISQDGKCRSVELLLPNMNRICRPIKLLYPLETSVLGSESMPRRSASASCSVVARPQRAAATAARQKLADMFEEEEELSQITLLSVDLYSRDVSLLSEMGSNQLIVDVLPRHKFSRFYSFPTPLKLPNGVKVQSVQMGFEYLKLVQHGLENEAKEMLSRDDLKWDATIISSAVSNWMAPCGKHQGPPILENANFTFKTREIYLAILQYQVKRQTPWYKEFLELINSVENPLELRFLVYSSNVDDLLSCGLPYKKGQKAVSYPGYNVYGRILRDMVHFVVEDQSVSDTFLRQLMENPQYFSPSKRSVLLVSDSQFRRFKKIRGGEVVPVSGGRYVDLAGVLCSGQFDLDSFRYILLYDGTNEYLRPNSYTDQDRKRDFYRFKDILLLESQNRPHCTIVLCCAFDHPRVKGNAEHARWVQRQFAGTPIGCLNWRDMPAGNPFTYDNGQIRKNLFDNKGFHLSNDGTKVLWDAICRMVPDLRFLSFKLGDPEAISKDMFKDDTTYRKRRMLESDAGPSYLY